MTMTRAASNALPSPPTHPPTTHPTPSTRPPPPTSVRHAHHDALDAEVGRAVDERLHARHERLAALQRKALGGAVLVVEEGLEEVGPREAVEDVQLRR